MTKNEISKLRTDRDLAASAGDHAEALILNDRIRNLKDMQPRVLLVECPSCRGRGYTNPAFDCRWCSGSGEVSEWDFAAFGAEP